MGQGGIDQIMKGIYLSNKGVSIAREMMPAGVTHEASTHGEVKDTTLAPFERIISCKKIDEHNCYHILTYRSTRTRVTHLSLCRASILVHTCFSVAICRRKHPRWNISGIRMSTRAAVLINVSFDLDKGYDRAQRDERLGKRLQSKTPLVQ